MSTLRVSTIQDTAGSNSSTPAAIANGIAKAWVNFNASSGTPVIRASFNVSSITDNGVGQFTLNFTTALVDANFSVSGSAEWTPSVTALSVVTVRTYTSSSIRIDTANSASGSSTDPTFVNVSVFR